jgi:hypothetical protein
MSNKSDVQNTEDKSDVPALPPVQDSLPTKGEQPGSVIQAEHPEVYSFIHAGADVVSLEETVVAGLVARAASSQYGADNLYKQAAKETMHHRRMFLAPERIRKLIGNSDAPDLFGASTDYRDSIRNVNKAARKDLIDAILAETPDLSQKAAEGEATDLLKRFDQNMKRELRILIDREFRGMGREGARIMLCYGFRHTSAIKSTQTIPENWKIEEKTGKLVIPAARPLTPQTDSDQVKAGETASAENQDIKDKLVEEGQDVHNPLTLINQALVLLRDAEALMADKDFKFAAGVTLRNRQQIRANLFGVFQKVANHLAPAPSAKKVEADKPVEVTEKA